jgi:hypothetical protein
MFFIFARAIAFKDRAVLFAYALRIDGKLKRQLQSSLLPGRATITRHSPFEASGCQLRST